MLNLSVNQEAFKLNCKIASMFELNPNQVVISSWEKVYFVRFVGIKKRPTFVSKKLVQKMQFCGKVTKLAEGIYKVDILLRISQIIDTKGKQSLKTYFSFINPQDGLKFSKWLKEQGEKTSVAVGRYEFGGVDAVRKMTVPRTGLDVINKNTFQLKCHNLDKNVLEKVLKKAFKDDLGICKLISFDGNVGYIIDKYYTHDCFKVLLSDNSFTYVNWAKKDTYQLVC
jgi:hypothetical protein